MPTVHVDTVSVCVFLCKCVFSCGNVQCVCVYVCAPYMCSKSIRYSVLRAFTVYYTGWWQEVPAKQRAAGFYLFTLMVQPFFFLSPGSLHWDWRGAEGGGCYFQSTRRQKVELKCFYSVSF